MKKFIKIVEGAYAEIEQTNVETKLPFGSIHDCWIDDSGQSHLLDRKNLQTHRELAAGILGGNPADRIDYISMAVVKGWIRIFISHNVCVMELSGEKVTKKAISGAINFIRRTPSIIDLYVEDITSGKNYPKLTPKEAINCLRRISLKNSISSLFDHIFDDRLVLEKYSENNSRLLRYLNSEPEFDPYTNWHWVCYWIDKNDLIEIVSAGGASDIDELRDLEPELFYKLDDEQQAECKEWVEDAVRRHEPSEVNSHEFFMPDSKLLNRQTWLVHFSDHAYAIRRNGFTHGVDQMDKLGLTTYMGDSSKKYGGYNFAFEAKSRYADFGAQQGKYGEHAVIFQNSGVSAWHHGDEEQQIIFWGEDVDPRHIIVLEKNYGDWCVMSRNDDILFKGEFTDAVKWVIQNSHQYRKQLFGK